ncbi:MAG: DUF4230 domain-containing protein [Victivallales bacterium]
MGQSNSIGSLLVMFGAVFVFGTFAVCVFMLAAYLLAKDGTKSACRAIEKFFGSGCRVSTQDHRITVQQITAILEIATARGEFEHNYNWQKNNRRFLGIPLPFTSKEAACRHLYVVKAGFDLKEKYCIFDFIPVGGEGVLARFFEGKSYHVRVKIPRPKILSLETRTVNVEDRSRWYDFWNGLNEADRNSIMSDMFSEARNHVAHAGAPLLAEAMQRLESGLRAIMPPHVKLIDFEWMDNPQAFDFECAGGINGIST